MTSVPGTVATSAATGFSTLGWVARRSALLFAILSAGIGAAVLIYALASDSSPVQAAKPAAGAVAPHKS